MHALADVKLRHSCGQHGLDGLVAESSFHPHLAFIDLEMPGIDGREVARRMRADSHTTARLICLTGQRDPNDSKACLDAGFDQLTCKPLMPATLSDVLDSARAELVDA